MGQKHSGGMQVSTLVQFWGICTSLEYFYVILLYTSTLLRLFDGEFYHLNRYNKINRRGISQAKFVHTHTVNMSEMIDCVGVQVL